MTISGVPCCICNAEADHNGMPCWKCWCETRAKLKSTEQERAAADEVARGFAGPGPIATVKRIIAQRDAAEQKYEQSEKIVLKRGQEIDRQMRRAEAAEQRETQLREALRSLLDGMAVTFSDPRIEYVEVQIDKDELESARATLNVVTTDK